MAGKPFAENVASCGPFSLGHRSLLPRSHLPHRHQLLPLICEELRYRISFLSLLSLLWRLRLWCLRLPLTSFSPLWKTARLLHLPLHLAAGLRSPGLPAPLALWPFPLPARCGLSPQATRLDLHQSCTRLSALRLCDGSLLHMLDSLRVSRG